MAYQKKNETEAEANVDVIEDIKTETAEVKKKPEKKKFSPTDTIPCISITAGELFYEGKKSKTLYTFADIDDVVEVEFRDLDYDARTKDAMMFRPRFIVQDEDFIALHPVLDGIYSSLHTIKDLKDILKMTPKQMEKAVYSLPLGAQEALKTIAATMVDDGTLDSVKRIQMLDSIFGTELLLRLNI